MQSENLKKKSFFINHRQLSIQVWLFELSLVIFFFSKLGTGITSVHPMVEILGSL